MARFPALSITQVSGTWTVDRRSYEPVDAEGHLDEQRLPLWDWRHLKTVRTAPFGCLLASVGDRGDPVVVGRSRHLVAPRPGRLELRINDKDEALGDNGGAVVVRVQIQNRSDCP